MKAKYFVFMFLLVAIVLSALVSCTPKEGYICIPELVDKGSLSQFTVGQGTVSVAIGNNLYILPDNVMVKTYIIDSTNSMYFYNSTALHLNSTYFLYKLLSGSYLLSETELSTFNYNSFDNIK